MVVVGESFGERKDERRLADAALGIHDGDNVAHANTPALDRCQEFARTTNRERPNLGKFVTLPITGPAASLAGRETW
jgi:hypothetical protein